MVHLVSISGKEVPIVFSHAAITNLCDSEGIAARNQDLMFEDFENWSMKRTYKMFFFGIKAGCRKNKERFPWKDLDSFIDEVAEDESFFESAIKLFAEDMVPAENGVKETAPK